MRLEHFAMLTLITFMLDTLDSITNYLLKEKCYFSPPGQLLLRLSLRPPGKWHLIQVLPVLTLQLEIEPLCEYWIAMQWVARESFSPAALLLNDIFPRQLYF